MRRAVFLAIGCLARRHDVWRGRPDNKNTRFHRKPSAQLTQHGAPSIHRANIRAAAYYIAFGPHGPRRPTPPDEGRKVFFLSAAVIAGACLVFAITRMFANPQRPRTMTKEWQEATEEYMKVCWQPP